MKNIYQYFLIVAVCFVMFLAGFKLGCQRYDNMLRYTFKNGYYKGALNQCSREGDLSNIIWQFKIDSIYFENTYIKNVNHE
jgi:hypothetical protein